MTAVSAPQRHLVDLVDVDAIAGGEALLGSEAGDVLRAAVAPEGERLLRWAPWQVRLRPDRSLTVAYRALLEDGSGSASEALLVAEAGRRPPDEAALVSDGSAEVAVWRFPDDPWLPGLPQAARPAGVSDLLDQIGLGPEIVEMRTRSYRPGRRAVIEVTLPSRRVYFKVVPPHRISRLQEAHRRLSPLLPVPRSLGWSEQAGIVALEGLPGSTLRACLETDRSGPVPDAAQILTLLDRLANGGRPAPALAARATDHAATLRRILPAEAEDGLASLLADLDSVIPEPGRPVHGDFHSSQLIVTDGRISGVVDVDAAGTGDRSDDLANLLAHLYALALDSPHGEALRRYGRHLIGAFDQVVDPAGLRLRIGAALVGYATGPFRVQEPNWRHGTMRRLAAARKWVDSAAHV